MHNNLLKLYGDKTEVMILGKRHDLWGPQHWPSELGALPTPVNNFRNLGFIIDEPLLMKHQVAKISSTCFAVLQWLKKILWLIPLSAQRTVIQALVISRLDYRNALYLGADKTTIQRLQLVQNAATRLLFLLPKFSSVSGCLRDC